MSVLNITKNNFDSVVNSGKTVLLDFYADWCGPCRMLAPTVHEIADELPHIVVGKVNVDTEPDLARRFSITSIPMLAVMKDGKVLSRTMGVRSKDYILELLEG